MDGTTATLSAALCGLTALWLAGCDAHALTARLPGGSSTGPAAAAPAPDTSRATATTPATPPPDPGLYSHQADDDRDAAARERAREKGCDEPGGCYYGVRLVGYPIEEAKRRALAYGFKGEIDVSDHNRHYSDCKPGTVCEVQPANWPVLDELTLYVNYAPRDLKINKPE